MSDLVIKREYIERFGLNTAAVMAAIEHYCSMSEGVCRASAETLSEFAGVSRPTALKSVKILTDCGAVFVAQKGGNHAVTQLKIGNGQIFDRSNAETVKNFTRNGKKFDPINDDESINNENHHNNYSQNFDRLPDETVNNFTVSSKLASWVKTWEANIGLVQPMIYDEWKELIETTPDGYFERAVKIGVDNGVRTWKYVRRCLENMITNGIDYKPSQERNHGKNNQHRQQAAPVAVATAEPVEDTPEELAFISAETARFKLAAEQARARAGGVR